MSKRTITTTVSHIRRGRVSVNGNPSYILTTADGVFSTATDAGIAYGIGNRDMLGTEVGEIHPPRRVALTLERGRIVNLVREVTE